MPEAPSEKSSSASSSPSSSAPSASTSQGITFIVNKPRLKSHTKSRAGCVTCKARKVKCSEEKPDCKNCQRRGVSCVYQSPSSSRSPEKRFDQPQTQNASNSLIMRKPAMTAEDLELMTITDAVMYYNDTVVPDMMPSQPPFRRPEVKFTELDDIPKILQRLLVVISGSVRSTKINADPLTNPDVCSYRGKCLRQLREIISNTTANDTTQAMTAVLAMTGAEVQLSSSGLWTPHHEAAHKLVALCGGLQQCQGFLDEWGALFLNYLTLDMLTVSTCPSRLIDQQSVLNQLQYIELLKACEKNLISSSCPCPRELLPAIVQTNILRYRLHNSDDSSSNVENQQLFVAIRGLLEAFDAQTWAAKVSGLGRTQPSTPEDGATQSDIESLTKMASCYQSAAFLYFAFSCSPSVNVPGLYVSMHTAHHTLTQGLADLFDAASSEPDAPLESQLWKCIAWPLVISTYVRIGWDMGSDSTGLDNDLERMRGLATKLGSGPMREAAQLMSAMRVRRAQRAVEGKPWRWDDGFEARYALGM